MSGQSLRSLSAAECEFLAENELITINPTFKQRQFEFVSGTFGPFEPYVPVQVPLWLAISLQKKGKCRIELPEWMSVESLEETIKEEKDVEYFTELPFHFMEIALLLLSNAPEEFLERDKISMLLQDLENIRMERLRMGILKISSNAEAGDAVDAVALRNIGSMEICSLKKFLPEVLKAFNRFPGIDSDHTDGASRPVEAGTGVPMYEDDGEDEEVAGRPRTLRKFR